MDALPSSTEDEIECALPTDLHDQTATQPGEPSPLKLLQQFTCEGIFDDLAFDNLPCETDDLPADEDKDLPWKPFIDNKPPCCQMNCFAKFKKVDKLQDFCLHIGMLDSSEDRTKFVWQLLVECAQRNRKYIRTNHHISEFYRYISEFFW